MQKFFKARPWLMGLLASAVLAACGGGSDGQDDALAQNEGESQAAAQYHGTTSTSTTSTTSGSWSFIAAEGSKFSLSSQRTVRYGASGKWTQKTVPAGTAYCSNWYFGRDPIYGTSKRCEVWNPASSTSTTAPSASLAWSASAQTGVTGYRLYYGTASRTYQQAKGSGISVGNVTSYTATGLQSGKVYYFAVTAIDGNGNESAYSNEATKQMP